MRYLCIQLACTGMRTQTSRGFEGQRGITVRVGLMDVTLDEDIGVPRLTNKFLHKIPKYLCTRSIYLGDHLSPKWGKGRQRTASSG